ncbi:HSPB1-associated protein 1-like [Ornithodoros turicata]|uniref:HSPB1-associated protein 1-like n=1 Tax=Ornithodoros turicata TaxID=34597 RepID=UPI0031397457
MSGDEKAVHLLEHFKQPVVFKGRLNRWKCAKWTIDEWAERTSDLILNFRVGPKVKNGEPLYEGDGVHLKATIKDFLNWTRGGRDNLDHELRDVDPSSHFAYSSYNYMSSIFGDYKEILQSVDWSCFGFAERHGTDSTLWLGSAGASTPCHQDTYGCNLVAQLIGRKSWTLFPPEESGCLYQTRLPYEESSVFSSVNLQDIDLYKYPRMEHCRPFLVTLEPGDVLFVPKMWWHLVSCVDTALSINTWIPMRSDERSRLEEAIVRTLVTTLVPCYEAGGGNWINPNEVLATPEENLGYIQNVLQNLASKKGTGPSEITACSNSTDNSALQDGIPVQSYTLEEYADKAGCKIRHLSTPRKKSKPSESMCFAKKVVSCFLDPDVIRIVADKLQDM